MIYLDNAATTAVDKRVLDAMLPYFTDVYGNPNSVHNMGFETYIAVENARSQVSKTIGVKHVGGVFSRPALRKQTTSYCRAFRCTEYIADIGSILPC